MKNYLTLLLLLFVQYSFAEKLIFTNNNEQVNITGDADINYQTGDISVTTVGVHQIINVNTQPVILGFYPSDYDVAIGANISVNWSVAFAETCTASVSSGVVSWSGNKQSNNGNWNETSVSVSQLPATLQLECQNAGNISTVKTFQLTEQSGVVVDPSFTYFRINNQSPSVTVNPPGTATVSWSTTDLNSCTASANPSVGGWSGTKSTNGSQVVTFSEDTTMTLTCDGIVRNVSVVYSENSSCTSSVYPPNLTRINGVYADNNDGFNFGESTNTSFLVNIKETQFVTLSNFSFPVEDTRRRIVFIDAPTNYNLMDVGTISVSECPGDFTQSAACVIPVNNNKTVFITTKPSDGSNDPFCKIDPTKTYYMNYIMTDDPYNTTPECNAPGDNECAMFYTESL